MAKTLEAQHRQLPSTITEMADTLIEVYGYASGRRIAREVAGDNNYWEKVALVIEQGIREE